MEKDIVTIKCYGRTEVLERNEAIAKFHDCMLCNEGSELSTYADIYGQLLSGSTLCSDEEVFGGKVIYY